MPGKPSQTEIHLTNRLITKYSDNCTVQIFFSKQPQKYFFFQKRLYNRPFKTRGFFKLVYAASAVERGRKRHQYFLVFRTIPHRA